jgi:hypothetical protein
MTQAHIRVSEQHSVVTDVIVSTLVGAMIILAGLLALAPYAATLA